jgi:DNA invertase Pin-like site-specific DNA recombinase
MIAVVTFGVMRRRAPSPQSIARAARIRGCFLAGISPTEAARRLGLALTTVSRHWSQKWWIGWTMKQESLTRWCASIGVPL